ncbi:MAG: hypothetical protein ACLQG5_03905 [Methanobacterium sp.]|jgi:hypothetical protein
MTLSHVEWEGLNNDIFIKKDDKVFIKSEALPSGISDIQISREYDYHIKLIINGTFHDDKELNLFKGIVPAGSIIKPFEFEMIDENFNIEYKFENYHIPNSLDDVNIKNLKDQKNSFELRLDAGNVKRVFKNYSDPIWHIEWFLNGPRYDIFNKHIEKRIKKKYLLSNDKDFTKMETYNSGYFSVEIHYEDKIFNIRVESVPNQIKPYWSGKIGVMYNINDGYPNTIEKDALREILGFIMGRELINVGYTKYDQCEEIVEDFVRSPPVRTPLDIIKICDAPDSPPINLGVNFEVVFNKFAPIYLDLRDKLKLNYLLYRYWTAQLLLLDVGIPVFGSALEDLIKRWIKANNSKFSGEYISKDNFERYLAKELYFLEEQLQDLEYNQNNVEDPSSIIYGKISNAYEMSISDKIKNFFSDIDLKIGEIENKAINARHGFAHGSFIKSDKEFKKHINNSEAYKTLINRILLKLFDYEWKYIDYYSENFPERPIDEPIGFIKKG